MRITIDGFKGVRVEQRCDGKLFLHGPNGSGKSAVLDGIRWAITGAVPTGKSRNEINLYCDQTHNTYATFCNDAGQVIASSCLNRDTDGRFKTAHERFSPVNEALLSPRDLIMASPWARVEWCYGALGKKLHNVGRDDVCRIMDETGDLERVNVPDHDLVFTEVRSAISQLRKQRAELEGALRVLPTNDTTYRDSIKRDHDDTTAQLDDEVAIEKAMKTYYARAIRNDLAVVSERASERCGGQILIHTYDDGARVWYGDRSIESISAGEAVVCLSAIAAAFAQRAAGESVILIEADPCDDDNLTQVLKIFEASSPLLVCVATCRQPTTTETVLLEQSGWTVRKL